MATIAKNMIGTMRLKGGTDEYQLIANKLVQNIQECVVRIKGETSTGVVKCILPIISEFTGRFGNLQVIFVDGDGNAAVNNIEIWAGGTDTINGAPNKIIDTNRGTAIFTVGDNDTWVSH